MLRQRPLAVSTESIRPAESTCGQCQSFKIRVGAARKEVARLIKLIQEAEKEIAQCEKKIEDNVLASRDEGLTAAMHEQDTYCRIQDLKIAFVHAEKVLTLEQKACRVLLCHACQWEEFKHEMDREARFSAITNL